MAAVYAVRSSAVVTGRLSQRARLTRQLPVADAPARCSAGSARRSSRPPPTIRRRRRRRRRSTPTTSGVSTGRAATVGAGPRRAAHRRASPGAGWPSCVAALLAAWIVDRLRAPGRRGRPRPPPSPTSWPPATPSARPQVAALERELDLIARPRYVDQQARGYGLGTPREIPFALAPGAPPLPEDAPGSAALRVGVDARRRRAARALADRPVRPGGLTGAARPRSLSCHPGAPAPATGGDAPRCSRSRSRTSSSSSAR